MDFLFENLNSKKIASAENALDCVINIIAGLRKDPKNIEYSEQRNLSKFLDNLVPKLLEFC